MQHDVVPCDGEDVAVEAQALQALAAQIAVLAQHDVAVLARPDIVGIVQLLFIRRLEDEAELLVARVVLPDLALAGLAAVRRHDVHALILRVVRRALEPAEDGAALVVALTEDTEGVRGPGAMRPLGVEDVHPLRPRNVDPTPTLPRRSA